MKDLSEAGDTEGDFTVEVIYALPERQRVARTTVTPGTLVGEVVERVAQQLSLPDPESVPVGIFGVEVSRDREVQPSDRLEIYRPLKIDAKTARHLRAQEQREAGVFKR